MSTSASGWAIMEKTWEKVQQKAFTRWVQSHLAKRGLSDKLEDLEKDFCDGILLLQFLEIISNQKMPGRMEKRPRMRIQKIQNTGMAMRFIDSLGVKLLGISGEDITDGNLKLILGMIWTIIQKYQIADITEEELTAKEALLLWCKKKTKNHRDCKIENLHDSWKSGMGFCALIHAHRPDLIDYDSLDAANAADNLALAFDVAEKQLGIPRLLDVEDLTDHERPDERSVITYLSQYYHYFASNRKGEDAARSVGRLVDLASALEKMQSDYGMKASDLSQWIADADERMKDRTHDGTADGAAKLLQDFDTYRGEEKPPKAVEKAELESLYSAIQMKLRNAGRPAYQAAEGQSPADIDAAWDTLGADERDREEWLRSLLRDQRALERLNSSFDDKADRLEKWIADKEEYLKRDEDVDSLAAAQSALALCDTFPPEYAGSKPRLEQVQRLADEIVALNDPNADAVAKRKDKITGDWEGLQALYDAKRKALADKLAKEQEKEALRLEFAKAAKEYKQWTKEKTNDCNTHDFGNTLEAVQAKGPELETEDAAITADNDAKKAHLDQLWSQLQALGVTSNPHTAITNEDVANMYGHVGESQKQRRAAYEEELARQLEMEEMRKRFAQMADAFAKSVADRQAGVDSQDDADPNAAIQAINDLYANGQPESDKLNDLARLQGQMTKMGIRKNPHTQYTLPALNVLRKDFARHVRNRLAALNDERDLKAEYENGARDLTAWVDAKVPELAEPKASDNTLASARAARKEWTEYKVGESADREDQRTGLNKTLAKLQALLASNGRPEYAPDAAVAPATVDAKWEELQAAEKTADAAIQAEVSRQERIAQLVRRFKSDVADLEAWLQDKEAYFAADDDDTSSLKAARLAVRVLDLNKEEVAHKRERVTEAEALVAQLDDLNAAAAPECRSELEALVARFDATQSAADAKAERLAKGLTSEQEKDDQASAFAEAARDLLRYTNNTVDSVGDYNFGADLEGVQAYTATMDEDDAAIRAEIAAKKGAADQLSAALGDAPNRYTQTTAADVSAACDKVEAALGKRREAHAGELAKQEDHDAKRRAFAEKANAFIEWIEAQGKALKALDGSPDERTAATQELYQGGKPNADKLAELEAAAEDMAAANVIGNQFTDYSLPTCQARNKQYETSVANFLGGLAEEKEFDERSKALAEANAAAQAAEEASLAFRSKEQQLTQWLAVAMETLNEPVQATSPADVEAAQAEHDAFVGSEVPPNQALLDEVTALAGKAQAAGVADASADGVTADWATMQAAVAAKADALKEAAATQATAEQLRVDFAGKAKAMNDFLEAQRGLGEPSGELEEQLADLTQRANVLATTGKGEHMVAVQAAADALSSAGVTDNTHTELTAPFLSAELQGLQNGLKERVALLNKDIMAKAGQDISPEELAEYKEVFDHFDRNADNAIDRLEFKAVLQTLGEDPTDDEVDAVLKDVANEDGLVSFSEFVAYQQNRAKKSDSKEDIIASFKVLAGDADYITADQLRTVLPAEKVEYLLSHMPAYEGVEGGYDYTAWTGTAM